LCFYDTKRYKFLISPIGVAIGSLEVVLLNGPQFWSAYDRSQEVQQMTVGTADADFCGVTPKYQLNGTL